MLFLQPTCTWRAGYQSGTFAIPISHAICDTKEELGQCIIAMVIHRHPMLPMRNTNIFLVDVLILTLWDGYTLLLLHTLNVLHWLEILCRLSRVYCLSHDSSSWARQVSSSHSLLGCICWLQCLNLAGRMIKSVRGRAVMWWAPKMNCPFRGKSAINLFIINMKLSFPLFLLLLGGDPATTNITTTVATTAN